MIRRLSATLMAACLSAACLAGNAPAQTGPISNPPNSTPWTGTGPISGQTNPSIPAFGQNLSEAELVGALRQMDSGLKEKALISKTTGHLVGKMYSLSVRVGDVTHRVLVFTEIGKGGIQFIVPLTRQLPLQSVSATFQGQLDEFNRRLVRCHLSLRMHREGGQTLLAQMQGNRPSSAQGLQEQLNQMLRDLEQARPLWGSLR